MSSTTAAASTSIGRFRAARRLAQAAVASDFVLGGVPGFLDWTIVSVSTLDDGTRVQLLVQNNTGAAQPIGSGATVHVETGRAAVGADECIWHAGHDQVLVSAAINEVVDNSFIDGASGYVIVATADAIRHPQEIVPNPGVRKIAVDPMSQRKMFTGPSMYNNLGRIIWSNISGTQFQVNGATDYTITVSRGAHDERDRDRGLGLVQRRHAVPVEQSRLLGRRVRELLIQRGQDGCHDQWHFRGCR